MTDRIPIVETYRGVGLHDQQDAARLDVVRSEIDAVFDLTARIGALVDWAGNRSKSPESRLLAKALLLAEIEEATEKRRARPEVDVAWLEAVTTGLDSQRWRSSEYYCSIILPRPSPGEQARNPVPRPVPLAD